MFRGLCILMHINFALSGHSFTSAAAERVFSLLLRRTNLEDYISTSVMLQYTSK